MYHPYLFQIMMRERERAFLEEVRRGGYHARRRRDGSGLSKKIARRLLSGLIRLKAIAGQRQKWQQAAEVFRPRICQISRNDADVFSEDRQTKR